MKQKYFGMASLNNRFDQSTIVAVWNKGVVVPGVDPRVRRKDACGAWIEFNQYGLTVENGTGWEIDHIFPTALGGTDDIINLQPLQWQNNRAKGDNIGGNWTCATVARN